jgi:hypothetical protein
MMPFARWANIVSVLFLGAGLCGWVAATSAIANAQAVLPPKAAAPKAAAPKAAVPKPDDHQLRTVIARMVESNRLFRSLFYESGAPKLKDPKIAGPREQTTIIGKKLTVYCVSAVIDTPLGFFPKSAGITFDKLPDGKIHIQMTVSRYAHEECTGPNVEPFRELERLRDKRRRELGKTS